MTARAPAAAGRIFRAAASLAVLLVLLGAVPWLLARVGRLEGFAEVDWRHLLTTPDTGTLLLAVMTLAAWLAWLVFAATVLSEVASIASRGRLHIPVPGGGWMQPVVSALVLAVVGITVSQAAAPVRAVAAPSSSSAPLSAKSGTPGRAPTPAGPSQQHSDPADAAGAARQGSTKQTPAAAQKAGKPAERVHVVERGDDLWSLAERYYSDGSQWRRIAADNKLADPDLLPVGLALRLTGLSDGAPDQTRQVVVKPGDTLAGLAEEHLGDATRWPEIQRLNASIKDPDVIRPGWRLVLPAVTAQTPGDAGKPAAGKPASPKTTPEQTAPEQLQPGKTQSGQTQPEQAEPAKTAPEQASPERESAEQGISKQNVTEQGADEHDNPEQAVAAQPDSPARSGTPAASQQETRPVAGQTLPPVEGTAADGERPERLEELGLAGDTLAASVAAMGVLLAAAIAGALATRRRRQLVERPPGRRIVPPGPDGAQLVNVLNRHGASAGEPPVAPTTAVLLGEGLSGEDPAEPVLLDLEQAGAALVRGPGAESLVAAATTGLVLQPWSVETQVVLAGHLGWVAALEEPQVRCVGDAEEALTLLERVAAERRIELNRSRLARPDSTLEQLRVDPDRWEAWAPQVFVFAVELEDAQWRRLDAALSGTPVGVSILALAGDNEPDAFEAPHQVVEVESRTRATWGSRTFQPALLDPTARRALSEVVDNVATTSTEPAPWWVDDHQVPPNLAVLPRRNPHDQEAPMDPSAGSHPTLLLLGPLALTNCQGEQPSRARQQCVEYCAWLQTHPGATASQMARQLLVAEGTRRSNMSRLRNWLGSDPNGELYLPDAYSGRIQLHPGVSSDWEHLQLLVGPGVNRTSTDSLTDALEMVRGAPMADAAPGQWLWAEDIRLDMVQMIRDIGVVLAERALADQQLELARWAVARAQLAAPDDELLMCARIRAEHLAGNRPEVERMVLQLTRSARNSGNDLSDQTVALMQQVMEGRRRALA